MLLTLHSFLAFLFIYFCLSSFFISVQGNWYIANIFCFVLFLFFSDFFFFYSHLDFTLSLFLCFPHIPFPFYASKVIISIGWAFSFFLYVFFFRFC